MEPYLQEGHTQHAIDLLLTRVQMLMSTAINEPQEGSHFDMQSELRSIVQSFCTKKLALEKDLTLQHAELAAGMKN